MKVDPLDLIYFYIDPSHEIFIDSYDVIGGDFNHIQYEDDPLELQVLHLPGPFDDDDDPLLMMSL